MIAFDIAEQATVEFILKIFDYAFDIRQCPTGLTFHSDQGWGYQMKAYAYVLQEHRIFQSMSRKGNCHDNSVMENFFGIMKQEMYYGEIYNSYDELKGAIDKYIEYKSQWINNIYNKCKIK